MIHQFNFAPLVLCPTQLSCLEVKVIYAAAKELNRLLVTKRGANDLDAESAALCDVEVDSLGIIR